MSEQPWREEWDRQADDWVELTTRRPVLRPARTSRRSSIWCRRRARSRSTSGAAKGGSAVSSSRGATAWSAVDGSSALARLATPSDAADHRVAVGDIAALPVRVRRGGPRGLLHGADGRRGRSSGSVRRAGAGARPGGSRLRGDPAPDLHERAVHPGRPEPHVLHGRVPQPDASRPRHASGRTATVFRFRVEHRPMEDYSRAFEAAGLAITALREPRPSDDLVAQHPGVRELPAGPDLPARRAAERRTRLCWRVRQRRSVRGEAVGSVRTIVARDRPADARRVGAVRLGSRRGHRPARRYAQLRVPLGRPRTST